MRISPKLKTEKTGFVKKLSELLKLDPRSEVDCMWYDTYEQWDTFEEYVCIRFTSGVVKKINVSADSCYGIIEDVTEAVYG